MIPGMDKAIASRIEIHLDALVRLAAMMTAVSVNFEGANRVLEDHDRDIALLDQS